MKFICKSILLAFSLAVIPVAGASTIWYVNGVNGNDGNDCKSSSTACKTIGHSISLASSGDSVKVAPATYTENLTIGINLKIVGASAKTAIIDGGRAGTVVTVTYGADVTLLDLTIRNGLTTHGGGGISNSGTLTISGSTISGNAVTVERFITFGGGGIIGVCRAVVIQRRESRNANAEYENRHNVQQSPQNRSNAQTGDVTQQPIQPSPDEVPKKWHKCYGEVHPCVFVLVQHDSANQDREKHCRKLKD